MLQIRDGLSINLTQWGLSVRKVEVRASKKASGDIELELIPRIENGKSLHSFSREKAGKPVMMIFDPSREFVLLIRAHANL